MLPPPDLNLAGGLEVELPPMAPVAQHFEAPRLADVAAALRAELARPEIGGRIRAGARIAIGAGSRGIANLAEVVATLVGELRGRGAEPFVFPAMGSHGGATAEGQARVLAEYGISEAAIGAPVRASMETVVVGELEGGIALHVDRQASEADGIVLVNRVKPHTTFRGAVESGLVKMAVIGMGKIAGATVMHMRGMDSFPELLPRAAVPIIERTPMLFGLALLENAYDQTARIEAVPAERIVEREPELQAEAKGLIGRLYFDDIDVLIIGRMGKDISGAGFDPNITGRNSRGVTGFERPRVQKIVVLDLSEASHGNATGMGIADVITRRLFERIDFAATYANVITSAYLDGGALPLVMASDRDAIRLAVKTLVRVAPEAARIVYLRDTLAVDRILVSEPMLAEAAGDPRLEALGKPQPLRFDGAGGLVLE